MEPAETRTLVDLCRPHHSSFSEAVESTLDTLDGVVPGALLLGRVDQSHDSCRVIGSRGTDVEALQNGAALPLAPGSAGAGNGNGSGVAIDPQFLGAVGMQAYATLPLELSNGRIVGVLAALESGATTARPDHVAMLAVGARLLSHEWESVERRAEARRLRGRLAESPGADTDTGLLNREAYIELLDHDWSLASRGTVESTLVVLAVGGDAERELGRVGGLAVKVAAEVLEGTIRRTDRAARVGDRALAATLIGCRGEQAPFFVDRFSGALERVTGNGSLTVPFTHAIFPLADATAPEQALALAEAAAGASTPMPADEVEVAR